MKNREEFRGRSQERKKNNQKEKKGRGKREKGRKGKMGVKKRDRDYPYEKKPEEFQKQFKGGGRFDHNIYPCWGLNRKELVFQLFMYLVPM